MLEGYEFTGKSLNKPIIRSLVPRLYQGQENLTVAQVRDGVAEYHKENGGVPTILTNLHSAVYMVLKELETKGEAESSEIRGGLFHWKILSDDSASTLPILNEGGEVYQMRSTEPTYIRTLSEFMNWTSQLDDGNYLFRGISNQKYDIAEASAYRRLPEDEERTVAKLLEINRNLINQSRQQGHDIEQGRQLSDLELLGKLQHFRAATCLIDFTYSAQVALWFACMFSSEEGANGKVVAVGNDPYKIKEVLPNMLSVEIDYFFQTDEDGVYPLYQWQPAHLNNRIVRQHSVFLFGGADIKPDEECIIAVDCKGQIRVELEKFSYISENTLFPDFDGFVRQNSHNVPYIIPNYRTVALRAFSENNLPRAVANYDAAINLEPDNAYNYYLRGLAKNHMDEYVEAIEDFNISISLNPSNAYSYYWRGRTNMALDQYEKAIIDFNNAISILDDISHFYYWRGLVYYRLEQYEKAIEDFDRSVNLEPTNAYSYYWRGWAKKKLERSSRAKQDFEMGLMLAQQDDQQGLINSIEEVLSELDDDVPF